MRQTSIFKISFITIICMLFFRARTTAQTDSLNAPKWVKLMHNPHANYFETVQSFNDFWKNKEKPEEEEEVFKSARKKSALRKLDANSDAVKYRIAYKKFIDWQIKTRPFVQPDGRILTMEERLELFAQERKMRENTAGSSN